MENYIAEIKKSISQIVKIPSEEQEQLDGMPFGKPCADALEYFLNLAKSMGFTTHNYENYAGEVTFGEGDEFAILAHLDVVPAGSGWHKDPFGGEIDEENKKIWGRGTMDDKGPAVISLYALKALKDKGFTPSRKIKLIVGCNEESGWRCIDYYNKVAHMPEEGISPDANFPVIYAEKGILHVKFTFKGKGKNFSGLQGGERANMVCDCCKVICDKDGTAYGLKKQGGFWISRGKSAHGSTPECGTNAIPAMLKFLGLDDMESMLFEDKMGLGGIKDETGMLTISPDVIGQQGEDIIVTCDIRYPATFTKDFITDILDKSGTPYEIVNDQAPLYNDKDSFLIRTLCNVYNEECGTDLKPIAIGGGTYARALKYGAAFGPEEDGEESTIHQADEYITFDKIEKCFNIYKKAIYRLTSNK
ncbi:MAG: Sapep family Mn(2+)-dependent dipeptidase [Clostridia bacterium]|nr:Sapep family Mn(2+)-dependent dipeptidase [Clostridia bacterium]